MKSRFHILLFLISFCFCFKWGANRQAQRLSGTSSNVEQHISNTTLRLQIRDYANTLVGTKYQSAGRSAKKGFDCSGFTHHVMKKNGIKLPTNSVGQSTRGRLINLENAQSGDLIFFKRKNAKHPFHVAMVFENKHEGISIIHSTSRGVVIDDLKKSKYWNSKIWKVKDVLTP